MTLTDFFSLSNLKLPSRRLDPGTICRLRWTLDVAGGFDGPIVTETVPFTAFSRAEADYQNYYADL